MKSAPFRAGTLAPGDLEALVAIANECYVPNDKFMSVCRITSRIFSGHNLRALHIARHLFREIITRNKTLLQIKDPKIQC